MEGISSGGSPPLSPTDFPPLPPSSSSASLLVTPLVIKPQTPPLSNNPQLQPESNNLKNSSSLWSDLFQNSNSQIHPFPPPSFSENGIPIVKAPKSILLKTAEIWKDHIICQFFGDPPPFKKIFADLNKIWGKGGPIQIHRYTATACLIFIPNLSIRNWALDVGFWSSGTVAFSATLWSPSATFAEQPLTSVPVWLTLSRVPPQLWSTEGLALIASGVGTPIPPANSDSISAFNKGAPKVRTIIPLNRGPLPTSVIVEDSAGAQVVVDVAYPPLPPLCSTCNKYGHGVHRCPQRSRIPPTSIQFLQKNTSHQANATTVEKKSSGNHSSAIKASASVQTAPPLSVLPSNINTSSQLALDDQGPLSSAGYSFRPNNTTTSPNKAYMFPPAPTPKSTLVSKVSEVKGPSNKSSPSSRKKDSDDAHFPQLKYGPDSPASKHEPASSLVLRPAHHPSTIKPAQDSSSSPTDQIRPNLITSPLGPQSHVTNQASSSSICTAYQQHSTLPPATAPPEAIIPPTTASDLPASPSSSSLSPTSSPPTKSSQAKPLAKSTALPPARLHLPPFSPSKISVMRATSNLAPQINSASGQVPTAALSTPLATQNLVLPHMLPQSPPPPASFTSLLKQQEEPIAQVTPVDSSPAPQNSSLPSSHSFHSIIYHSLHKSSHSTSDHLQPILRKDTHDDSDFSSGAGKESIDTEDLEEGELPLEHISIPHVLSDSHSTSESPQSSHSRKQKSKSKKKKPKEKPRGSASRRMPSLFPLSKRFR